MWAPAEVGGGWSQTEGGLCGAQTHFDLYFEGIEGLKAHEGFKYRSDVLFYILRILF